MTGKESLRSALSSARKIGACGICADFASEAESFDFLPALKECAVEAGLKLYLQIGGCEAMRDLYDASALGADGIIAPMIESAYAFEKFIGAFDSVFPAHDSGAQCLISLDTMTSVREIPSILSNAEAARLDGVMIDRADIALSSGRYMNPDEGEMTMMICEAAAAVITAGKQCIIGGGVSEQSVRILPSIHGDFGISLHAGIALFQCNPDVNDRDSLAAMVLSGIQCEDRWRSLKHDLLQMKESMAKHSRELFDLKYSRTAEKADRFFGAVR